MFGITWLAWPIVKAFLGKHWQVFAIGAALTALTVTILVYGAHREQKGAIKTELRVERKHTETIREVRADERLAQQVTDAISAELAKRQNEQKAQTDQTLKEINDAIASLPSTAPAERAAVLNGVRDVSNAAVARANRAAEYTGPAD